MTRENRSEYDVIIVGAGLVGASFALSVAAGKEGGELSIALIEANSGGESPELPGYDPRVVALTPHSQRLFERLGVWPQMVAQRVSPYLDMEVWDAEGTGKINFTSDQVQQPCLGHIVENRVVLAALISAVETHDSITLIRPERVKQVLLPIEGVESHLSRGSAVSGDTSIIKRDAGAVSVLLESGDRLDGALLVAADGAQSKVRSLVNLPTREWGYGQKAIVTTVYTSEPHLQTAYQRFLSTGPLAFLPLQGNDNEMFASSIVWSADEDFADHLMSLDDRAFCQRLASSFERRLGEITRIEKRYCIPLRQRHAIDYFKSGVALIGDAAHSIHPLAGQGVNLGLLDCQVLAGEILRAKERSIPLGETQILRRYQRQRKGNNLAMMGFMEAFKRLFGSDDIALRWLRNEGMGQLDKVPLVKNTIIRQAMGL